MLFLHYHLIELVYHLEKSLHLEVVLIAHLIEFLLNLLPALWVVIFALLQISKLSFQIRKTLQSFFPLQAAFE